VYAYCDYEEEILYHILALDQPSSVFFLFILHKHALSKNYIDLYSACKIHTFTTQSCIAKHM